MNLAYRYLFTAMFALLAFGFPLAIVVTGSRQVAAVEQKARNQLIAAGRADEAASLSLQGGMADFGMEVTPWEANCIFAADLVLKLWWVCILVAIALSYGIFLLTGYFPRSSDRRPIKDSLS